MLLDPFSLVAAATQVVPGLVRWAFGDDAAEVADKVAGVAQTVLGTTDPASVSSILRMDPAKAWEFKVALARIEGEFIDRQRQRDHEALLAAFADVANARSQTVELAKTGSPIAWGAPIISAIVMGMLGYVLIVITQSTLPPGQERIVDLTIGTLLSMASGVVGYWVGNSIGARQSAETMRQITERMAGRAQPW